MICLTGDVHHPSLESSDQKWSKKSEAALAVNYANIAHKYGIKVTLFITGRTFLEDRMEIKNLLGYSNLEIGGHTWSAFRPQWLHKFFRVFLKSNYGPKVYQRRDIERTISIIRKTIKSNPLSWRTHGYASDFKTLELLEDTSIKVVSDNVDDGKVMPEHLGKLVSLPMNVLPDHEHLYHGPRTEEEVENYLKRGGSYEITNKSYYIDDYFRIVKEQVEKINEKNGIATLLLHPICMKVADDFKNFEDFCKWVSEKSYKTIWCKEATQHVRGNL